MGFLSHNKPLGSWASVPPGAQPPPPPRGPPTRVFVSPTRCGPGHKARATRVWSAPPLQPSGTLPREVASSVTPAPYQAGVPQEGKTEAAQPPTSHPRWGRRLVAGSAPETHCPATPCSARWLEGTGGETHPQPRARSWGKEGVGQGQPPPPFLRSQGPHHLSLGPGSWGTCSSVPHSPPHLHPPQALARPTLLPLLANLRLMEMSCLKLSPSPN